MKAPSRRLWMGLASVVLLAAVFLLLYAYGPPEVWHYFFRKTWGKMFEAKGQRQLCAALNKYYHAHGEYPPFLLGGYSEAARAEHLLADYEMYYSSTDYYGDAADEGLAKAKKTVECLSDPLLAGGYLRRYPTWPYVWDYGKDSLLPDPRGLRRVRNIVSSPNDPIVEYYQALASPVIEARLGGGEARNAPDAIQYYSKTGLLEAALRCPRVYCGGVYRTTWHNSLGASSGKHPEWTERMQASAFSAPFCWALYWIGGDESRFDIDKLEGQFGYQRGDTIEALEGGTPQEAWLWFYGFGSKYAEKAEDLPGLDLVDNENGLIQPDGIPDGIVLLYKLKDGKVIEVVKKYD